MAQRFDELSTSRTFGGTRDDPQISTKWRARGYSSELDVYTAALINTPFGYNHPAGWTLYRQIPPQITEVGHEVWDVALSYGRRRQESGDWNFSCQTSGGTLRITHSKEVISTDSTNGAADIGTVGQPFRIGENGEGVDVVVPNTRYSFSYSHPQGEVTVAYTQSIGDHVGEVNSTAWGAFPEATALLIGFDASDGREQPATITYHVLYSKGVEGLTIRDMVGINKKGHHYIDIEYENEAENNEAVKLPRHVLVHRIYEESDFATFIPFTPS